MTHEDERLVVALRADDLDGLADFLVVHGQVVRISDGLVGAQGAPVLAHVERVERGTCLAQSLGHLGLKEVVVAPVQVQDRHACVLRRRGSHEGRDAWPFRVVDQLDRARLVPVPQDVRAPIGAGRAGFAPGCHDIAPGSPLVRRGRGLHLGQVVRAARVGRQLVAGRGVVGNAHVTSITCEVALASLMRRGDPGGPGDSERGSGEG